jgi:hypothetical protein
MAHPRAGVKGANIRVTRGGSVVLVDEAAEAIAPADLAPA